MSDEVDPWQAQTLAALRAGTEADGAAVLRRLCRHFALLERLTIEVAHEGYYVRYGIALDASEAERVGTFMVIDGVPSITMLRALGTYVATDPFETLLTLAHEYGHALAWRAGYRKQDYLAVVDRANENERLSEDEAVLVLDEECRAWRYGRTALSDLGLTSEELAAFEARKGVALEGYCSKLHLAPERWKEREATCMSVPRDPLKRIWCDACAGERWQREEGALR